MRNLFLLVTVLSVSLNVSAQDFFGDANTFFRLHVSKGKVNYRQVKRNPTELNKLLDFISTAPEYQGEQEKAFLINSYNIFVIKGIVDQYPTEGPLAIAGFFDKQGYKLRGKKITLNDLEKGTLAKQFPDPRLHFALVCAAIGCPKLASFAFQPKSLEAQLDERTSFAINDPSFVKRTENGLQLSQIFEWYAADFGGKEKLVEYVQRYYTGKIKFDPKYSFYEYNWNLNEIK